MSQNRDARPQQQAMYTMINKSNGKEIFKFSCTKSAENGEIPTLVQLVVEIQKETYDNIHSLQKSVAGLREQVQDFRAEHAEDNAEVKRQLSELRRNKVWFPRERV